MNNNELISTIKSRLNHHESKTYLKEKYLNKLVIASQGGLWSITPEFLGFLKSSDETIILLDNYKNPIRVNTKSLLLEAEEIYKKITEAWFEEHQQLSALR